MTDLSCGLTSFRLASGLRVPVANVECPGTFLLPEINPLLGGNLPSLGEETRMFPHSIQSLADSIDAISCLGEAGRLSGPWCVRDWGTRLQSPALPAKSAGGNGCSCGIWTGSLQKHAQFY